jgi:hypothetical protein
VIARLDPMHPLITNPWISLFDSAMKFDREAALQKVRHFMQSDPSEPVKALLKGYMRPSRMPAQELERRVISVFNNKNKHEFSKRIVKGSFRDHFFGLAQLIASWAYCSTFTASVEDRLMLAWAYASFQSGWSPGLLIRSLVLEPPFPEDFLERHAEIPSSLIIAEQASFRSQTTDDAVAAWRRSFPFGPDEVFWDAEKSNDGEITELWSEARTRVVEKDVEGLCHALSQLAFSGSEDFDGATEAAIDLVLLGIDLSDGEMVSKGTGRVREVMPDTQISKERILTVLMLGYAFLDRAWERFLGEVSHVEPKDSCLLGFIGSLFCKSGRIDHALRFFFAAFEKRTSPLSWPLVALSQLDGTCRSAVEEALVADEVPFSIDRPTGQRIIEALSPKIPLIDSDIITLMRRFTTLDLRHPRTERGTGRDEEHLEQHPKHDKPAHVDWSTFMPDLAGIVALYNEIAEEEILLNSAQDKRQYDTIADVAAKLMSAWSQIGGELHNLVVALPGRLRDAFDLPSLAEKRQLSPLTHVIERLNEAYTDKRNRDKEELETEIRAFRVRVRVAGLERLLPEKKIDRAEFEGVKQEIEPELKKEEKLQALRKGILDIHKFEREFKDPEEREVLILEVLDELVGGELALNANLVDIIGAHKWSGKDAVNVMTQFLTGLAKLSELGKIEQPFFVDTVLPFIVDFALRAGVSPLMSIIENAEIARLVTATIGSKLNKNTKALLQTISSEMDSAFMERVDLASFAGASLQLLREILIYLDEFETKVPISTKIQLLSAWVLRMLSVGNGGAITLSQELQVLEKLKVYLDQEGRLSEAVLLVAAAWRELGNDEILDGFEGVFVEALLDLIDKGEDGRSLVKSLFQNPGWLIREPEGVAMFLYLCHTGDFQAIVDMAKYTYFQELKEAAEEYPVLVGEFFLKLRFGLDVVWPEEPRAADHITVSQVLRDLEHDLQRPSMYRTWEPASEYQGIFNHKIEALKQKVLSCPPKITERLRKELEAVNPHEWIEEADKSLKVKAKYHAHESMERYIRGQVNRLLSLLEIRSHIEATDMLSYLYIKNIPLRDRLRAESIKIGKEPAIVAKVYGLVLEAMQ